MFNSSLSRAAHCATFLLTACVSYHDSRLPEQQKSALNAALNDLVGDYEIVDSRPASDYRRVSIAESWQSAAAFTRSHRATNSPGNATSKPVDAGSLAG